MSLVLDISQAELEIAGMLARIQDPVPFFDYVGETEKEHIRRRIMSTKLDPEGNPWVPWASYTEEKRRFQGNSNLGIMWDSGHLLDSIYFAVDGIYGVDIGTFVLYAEQHQEGSDRVPKREIFGWETDMLPVYAQAFVAFIEGVRR